MTICTSFLGISCLTRGMIFLRNTWKGIWSTLAQIHLRDTTNLQGNTPWGAMYSKRKAFWGIRSPDHLHLFRMDIANSGHPSVVFEAPLMGSFVAVIRMFWDGNSIIPEESPPSLGVCLLVHDQILDMIDFRLLNPLWRAVCQTLRILSFTVTTLPSPNYHCRTPRETAVAPWPRHWWGHIFVDLKKQVGLC